MFSIEERDEYDDEFEKLRELTLKNRQVQSKEELEETKLKIEECQKKLKSQKEQVLVLLCFIRCHRIINIIHI